MGTFHVPDRLPAGLHCWKDEIDSVVVSLIGHHEGTLSAQQITSLNALHISDASQPVHAPTVGTPLSDPGFPLPSKPPSTQITEEDVQTTPANLVQPV